MANISERIREARKEAGLTQEAVARRAELSTNMLSRLERGTIRDPHYSTLEGIAHALGTTVAELAGEREPVPLADAPETGFAALEELEELLYKEDYAGDPEGAVSRAQAAAHEARGDYLPRGMRIVMSIDNKSVEVRAVAPAKQHDTWDRIAGSALTPRTNKNKGGRKVDKST